MKGAPAARVTLACDFTSWGTLGFCWIPVKNEAVKAAIRTETARAVPIEAPSWVAVFCSPPTSEFFSVRYGRNGHRAELRRQRTDAETDDEQGDDHDGGVGPDLEAPDQHRDAGDERQQAEARRRGEGTRGERSAGSRPQRGAVTARAATGARPSRIGDSPSATERNSGTMKKIPAWIRNRKRKVMSPPVSCRRRQERRVDKRLLAGVLRGGVASGRTATAGRGGRA